MNNQGSIWRKWDLQVGTKYYNRYTGVTFDGEKLANLIELTGLTAQQINSNHKSLNDEEYAKLFVEHFVNFNDTDVIALANHNSGDGIQEIVDYLQSQKINKPNSIYSNKTIFPGTEIGGNDRCHIIIVFNPITVNNKKFEFEGDGVTIKRELTWKEYIEKFLDNIKIPNPRFNSNQPANSSSLGAKEIIGKSDEWDFVPVFPHIVNEAGLWKELQDSNRKEIYNDNNFGIVDFPVGTGNQDLKRICDGKHDSWGTKSIAVINSSDANSILSIGSKFSHIKCDPTIKGLKHLFIEPLDRVRTGLEPEILNQVLQNRTKYVKSIAINRIESYTGNQGEWFDSIEIPLNHELVAIIGNKGSGKSALADIISLCANFKGNHEDFSFLNSKKFNVGGGKIAKNFEATITWESGVSHTKSLDGISTDSDVELVKYLPQGYFERLTNEISSVEEFKKEIENVVYTHLNEDDKIGVNSFEELISKRKELIHHEINILKERLTSSNQILFEKEKKLNVSYKANLEALIRKKNEELAALIEPVEVKNPNEDASIAEKNKEVNESINSTKSSIERLEIEIEAKTTVKRDLIAEINSLKDIKQRFKSKEEELSFFKSNQSTELNKFNINFDHVLKYEFNYTPIDALLSSKERLLISVRVLLGDEASIEENFKSLASQLEVEQKKLFDIQQNLGEAEKKYHSYLSGKKSWEEAKTLIVGDVNTPNSLRYYEQELKYVNESLVSDISSERIQRLEIVSAVFIKMTSILNIYKSVKQKIDIIIGSNSDLLNQYKINIDASFNLKTNFQNRFLNFVSLNKSGTFYGKDNADQQLNKLIENVNWDNFVEVKEFLENVVESFFNDKRNQNDSPTSIETQIEEVVEFYDYLFSLDFLDYNYELKQGEKKLEQLSPGEKGALLLIFYLLLDNNNIPLIIDQPEDNLDNNSVANVLVPFIKKAKAKRQIILVTHNPNLAVVADAEQVIYVDLDKENRNKFSFKSGAIENPEINTAIVKVLEGAMPAFNKRKQKYYE